MTEQLDWIEQAAKVGTDLKESIRLGHELLRDLKQIRKELADVRHEIQHVIDNDIPAVTQTAFVKTYGKLLSDYQDEIADIADKAVTKLIRNTRQSQEELVLTMQESVTETIAILEAKHGKV